MDLKWLNKTVLIIGNPKQKTLKYTLNSFLKTRRVLHLCNGGEKNSDLQTNTTRSNSFFYIIQKIKGVNKNLQINLGFISILGLKKT